MDTICCSILEYKLAPNEGAEAGTFECYGAAFGNTDFGGDVCEKGCFADAIKDSATKPLMLWMHDRGEPVGEWIDATEDARGLKLRGRLWSGKGIPRADQAHAMLKSGVGGFSIGFIARKWSVDERKGVRRLQSVDLKEVSIVTFPMNDKARLLRMKSDDTVDPALVGMLTAIRDESLNLGRAASGQFQSINRWLRSNG